jgi:hypothetical protein
MEPKIVEEANRRPGKCLASRDTEGPFIDTGCWTREHDPYLYLSVRWFEETARDLLGMVSAQEVEERFATVEAQLKEQAERIAELQRFEEAAAEYEEARQAVSFVEVEPVANPPSAEEAIEELRQISEEVSA